MIFVNFRSLWLLGFEVMYTGTAINEGKTKQYAVAFYLVQWHGANWNHTKQQIPAFFIFLFS
jgi:hypothetical protein